MKKLLPFAITLLLAISSSIGPLAIAAPQGSASFSPNPKIEPAAVALLDKSARAYAAMKGVSMEFVTTETLLEMPIITNVAFSRPDMAKIETSDEASRYRAVASAGQLAQTGEGKTTRTQYSKKRPAIQVVVEEINLIHAVPLYFLLAGQNPATATKWSDEQPMLVCESASLLADNGVLLRLKEANTSHPPLYLRLYFGKNDKLLRRIEADMVTEGKKETVHVTKLTSLQANPKFAPDTFKLAPATPIKK